MGEKMLRISKSVALVLAFSLGISSAAQAASSISLIWRASGTATLDTTVDGAGPYVLDVVVTADTLGVVALSVSFRFDEDLADELDFVAGSESLDVPLPGMGNAFSPILPGLQSTRESTGAISGLLRQFDQSAGLSTGLAAVDGPRTLGSLIFTVNTQVGDGPDVVPGFFTNGIDGMNPMGGGSVVPDFVPASVPEPASAATGAFALLALAALRRRR